ncbi:MAG: undecaprenyl-diphosphate phosphatase [Peptoniphilaceae bacterium]|nr:undecaprenyl-diphosphate phosphatase [Peptoniphilaceae bacterium]MDD7383652.1 undecaprenyl-diphosphate phosphatase [Peptoniphilaceae bacterium]MDY3737823.1 undecaprenyl-diphosphate phosphatase [Peptoniphilaceae bacterium]
MDILKVIILSIIEGITEFLPVSSTGHLILANEFIKLNPEKFSNAFSVIIQFGAILSVVVVYFTKLNPLSISKVEKEKIPANYNKLNFQSKLYFLFKNYDKKTISLWIKVIVGVIPAFILGFLFDDLIDEYLFNPITVAFMLIFWGIIIILIENRNAKKENFKFNSMEDVDLKTSFLIGIFQCLAMIPGTSRSAATIIGAMLLGTNRKIAADFSFFLAIPTMLGATLLKLIKNISGFSLNQWALILFGSVISFFVAYFVIIKFLDYVKNHDFKIFGYYRIILSILVFIYFLVIK